MLRSSFSANSSAVTILSGGSVRIASDLVLIEVRRTTVLAKRIGYLMTPSDVRVGDYEGGAIGSDRGPPVYSGGESIGSMRI